MDPDIGQLHSSQYRSPEQLQPGATLVVGAGNSGAEIALELSAARRVLLAGSGVGQIPFQPESGVGGLLLPVIFRLVFHRLLTTDTPMGRRARPKKLAHGEPLIRTKTKDLDAAGVERVGRIVRAHDGLPALENGDAIEVANVIWCTGFEQWFFWIDLPVLENGQPVQERGIVAAMPGLYFVGLKFLYSASSAQVHGVGRDAARIADAIASGRDRTADLARDRAAPYMALRQQRNRRRR